MKKLLQFLSAAMLIPTMAYSQCTPIFQETFEEFNPNWTLSGAYSQTLNTSDPYRGLSSLQLQGGNGTHTDALVQTLANAVTPNRISWAIKPNGAGTINNIKFYNASNSEVLHSYFSGSAGKLFIGSHQFNVTIGVWNKIELRNINYTYGTFDVYINNVLEGSTISIPDLIGNSIKKVSLYNLSSGIAHWDNIVLGDEVITLTGIVTDPICHDAAEGSIYVIRATSNSTYVDYNWAHGATGDYLLNLAPGNYTVTATEIGSGCTATASFTIGNPAQITGPTQTATACDSVVIGSTVIKTSGAHNIVFPAHNDCDSIVTYNVTINESKTGIAEINACGDYTWIDGITYSTSNNTATMNLTSSGNCDSIVTLNLTITNISSGVTVSNGTITANYQGGTYQWLKCEGANKTPIPGATNISYSPSETGMYAVEITHNGCSKTSLCFSVTANPNGGGNNTSLEVIDENIFSIYPNPTTGLISISSTLSTNEYSISILNSVGQKVMVPVQNNGASYQVDLGSFAAGIYFVEVKTANGKSLKKIVKN